MSRLTRGILYAVGIPAVGYLLLKVVTPSPEEMRQRLGNRNPAAISQIREQNQELMKMVQKQAGITDDELTKK